MPKASEPKEYLTPYEQAQGFQMMLDLGESMTGIAEKTGFSATTVRHRVKLLELDQEKLKKTSARGATLQDFLELEKIEDVELRNSVLDTVATSNFDYELKRALDHEESVKKMAQIIADIEQFATKVEETTSDMKWVKLLPVRQQKGRGPAGRGHGGIFF